MAKAQGKAALAAVGLTLVQRLADPAVQDAIARQAVKLADMAKEWNDERRRLKPAAEVDIDVEGRAKDGPGSGGLGAHFGQGKLERRVKHLQSSVSAVTEVSPEAAVALAGTAENLAAIEVALEVADGLPLIKRKRAHFRLDEELDKLERLVFDASLPSAARPPAD